MTIVGAHEYWDRYYADRFQYGLGTEHILGLLGRVPLVSSWADLGCGSESMLWAIALRAASLVAVDADAARLAILQRFAASGEPRGVHLEALRLCGRDTPGTFPARCRTLSRVVQADCLTGRVPADRVLRPGGFDLVTQFGLLGLCRGANHFTACFAGIHRLLGAAGWAAGANWVTRQPAARVRLTERLFHDAADRTCLRLDQLTHVPITADPDFSAVWIYLGRKT